MCLAIPAQIVGEINDNQMAEVDILGVRRWVSVMMTPAAKHGDYVLVHAGFAIEVVDEEFARETLELLREGEVPLDDVPPIGTEVEAS